MMKSEREFVRAVPTRAAEVVVIDVDRISARAGVPRAAMRAEEWESKARFVLKLLKYLVLGVPKRALRDLLSSRRTSEAFKLSRVAMRQRRWVSGDI
jgi:hypothetical protein